MPTQIEWTDETWNPTTGCTKVSPGCDNCYAERVTKRFGHNGGKFDELILHPDRLVKPLRWRKPRRIFVDSMSDLFHRDIPEAFLATIWDVMDKAPDHQFQILTKRPHRMLRILNQGKKLNDPPLHNVWLGTSIETSEYLKRITPLVWTRAAYRFLSFEPLLGPIGEVNLRGIDWVIVGGESGSKSVIRPMDPAWARAIRRQCEEWGVPFFFKQHGGYRKCECHGAWGCRLLDGELWDGYPSGV